MVRLVAVAVTLLVVCGCGGETKEAPTPGGAGASPSAGTSSGPAKADAPQVPWEDYSPAVRQRIDNLGAAKKCRALQREFDKADALNDATTSRTGHNNAELMSYVYYQMDAAGCSG